MKFSTPEKRAPKKEEPKVETMKDVTNPVDSVLNQGVEPKDADIYGASSPLLPDKEEPLVEGPDDQEPLVEPAKESYGFKLGQKKFQISVEAVEIKRVDPPEDDPVNLVEVTYKMKFTGIRGGMEKDVKLLFSLDQPQMEDILVEQNMLDVTQEAKRRGRW